LTSSPKPRPRGRVPFSFFKSFCRLPFPVREVFSRLYFFPPFTVFFTLSQVGGWGPGLGVGFFLMLLPGVSYPCAGTSLSALGAQNADMSFPRGLVFFPASPASGEMSAPLLPGSFLRTVRIFSPPVSRRPFLFVGGPAFGLPDGWAVFLPSCGPFSPLSLLWVFFFFLSRSCVAITVSSPLGGGPYRFVVASVLVGV